MSYLDQSLDELIPKFIEFANYNSYANLLEAIDCLKSHRSDAFIVAGPPGSGKTILLHSILGNYGHLWPSSIEGLISLLGNECTNDFLFFDDIAGKCRGLDVLCNFVAAPWFCYRQRRNAVLVEKKKRCVVFLTTAQFDRPATDTFPHFKVIQLAEPQRPFLKGEEASRGR